MARDPRLSEFGPDKYIGFTPDVFKKKRQLNFDDLFSAKADSGTAPWTPSRFESTDLLRRIQTRKLKFNPGLQFVGEDAQQIEIFAGIGRFNRKEDYDFNAGRGLTKQRPEDQPGFNPIWKDMYSLSPTLKPDDRVSNPMPRASNPDPKGYLMATAEKRAENEVEGNLSVAQLLKGEDKTESKTNSKKEEEKSKIV
jgi:hypothetical protein